MTLLLIESVFGARFKDREESDIKPDVHNNRLANSDQKWSQNKVYTDPLRRWTPQRDRVYTE